MQKRAPVARNAALRAGYGLTFRMGARRCQLGAVNDDSFGVIVKPILAWLKTRNHRMPAVVIMLRCVLARRTVATADMPAFGAAPQVQPPPPARQALDATTSARFDSGIDSVNVPVPILHCASPISSPAWPDSTSPPQLRSPWPGARAFCTAPAGLRMASSTRPGSRAWGRGCWRSRRWWPPYVSPESAPALAGRYGRRCERPTAARSGGAAGARRKIRSD